MVELAAYRRADLCYLRGPTQPVEARHQGCVQARGDRQSGRGNRRDRARRRVFALRLQHRFRHFLHE
jgi:hypothetical protein